MNLTQPNLHVRATRRVLTIAAVSTFALGACASAMSLHFDIAAPGLAPAPRLATAHQEAPSADEPVRVSGGVMNGQAISKVPPEYPAEAKEQRITGTVVLHAIIGKDGTVQELVVISGPKELQNSALDAVRQWVYKPYLLNGNPVAVDTTINVTYSLAP